MANQENWIEGFRTIDDGRTSVANYIWDTGTLAWVVDTGGGGGGGGGLTDAQLRATPVPVSFAATSGTRALNVQVQGADLGLIAHAVIHGQTTAGGGTFVDVKVNPSGALTVETTPSTLGQQLMAASAPVVIASNQSAIPVTGTFWQATQPVSGTFFQATQPVSIAASVAVTGPLTDVQLRASAVPVSLASTTITGSVAVTGPLTDVQLRASAVPVSLASTTITGSVAVTGPLTDAQLRATPVPTLENRPATTTRSSVAGAAADTLILASNANRRGATVYNDSTAILYLALGTAAASTTDFTVKMVADAYFEVPFSYTGQIRGIWASATGNARVGEVT